MSRSSIPVPGRGAQVAVALGLGVAAMGFAYGTRQAPATTGYQELVARADSSEAERRGARPAPSYAELRAQQNGADRERHKAAFAALASDRPALLAEVERSPEAVAAERARRAAGRAYAGAPPVIPHPIDQRGYPNCGSCHEEGMQIGERRAPARSHPAFASCTQCHAPASAAPPGAPDGPAVADNAFVGAAESSGERAWPMAPPTIPHSTLMRERCDSCHGLLGRGIRTTHPYRQSCQQCHAPSARLDQRDHHARLSPSASTAEPGR